MDIDQLRKDYEEVMEFFSELIPKLLKIPPSLSPIRCHEMAILTDKAMKEKGYACKITDGILWESFEDHENHKRDGWIYHSWVRVNGLEGSVDSAILCFRFLRRCMGTKMQHKIVIGQEEALYEQKEIPYDLNPCIEQLAKNSLLDKEPYKVHKIFSGIYRGHSKRKQEAWKKHIEDVMNNLAYERHGEDPLIIDLFNKVFDRISDLF